MMKSKLIIKQILAFLLLLIPDVACAQWSFDVSTVEAMVADHKRIRSVLIARSTVEQANKILHDASKDANIAYKDINVKLDRYTRCFVLIDLILQGTSTVFALKNTISDVSDKVGKYKGLLETYTEKCLLHGDIVSSDTIIIGISKRTIERISDDADDLINSFKDLLAIYAVGAATNAPESKTVQMITVLRAINSSLDDIRLSINVAYIELWKYIRVRTTYWKNAIYGAKSMTEIANDAFSRWKVAADVFDY
jgi:hypothetical protein